VSDARGKPVAKCLIYIEKDGTIALAPCLISAPFCTRLYSSIQIDIINFTGWMTPHAEPFSNIRKHGVSPVKMPGKTTASSASTLSPVVAAKGRIRRPWLLAWSVDIGDLPWQ
jgi:hypothetical protein